MKLNLHHIKEFTKNRFEKGLFSGQHSVEAIDFYDRTCSIHENLDIIVDMVVYSYKGTLIAQRGEFKPLKEDVITFVKTVMRQENLDILLEE